MPNVETEHADAVYATAAAHVDARFPEDDLRAALDLLYRYARDEVRLADPDEHLDVAARHALAARIVRDAINTRVLLALAAQQP